MRHFKQKTRGNPLAAKGVKEDGDGRSRTTHFAAGGGEVEWISDQAVGWESWEGTNTYLIGKGRDRLLIDTGEGKPSWSASLRGVLEAEKATVKQALLTHWHRDHVGGVLDLLEICPNAKVCKYDGEGDELNIEDGQVFTVEGATLRTIHTPGHTTDHVTFLLEEENALFTGDNVLGHGTAVFEDLAVYIATLEKMRNLGASRGYPGHGAVIEDCKAKITEYIEHRRQREEEVLRVLKFGSLDGGNPGTGGALYKPRAMSPDELVSVIYPDIADQMRMHASHGLIQALMKLENEGKVTSDSISGRWQVSGGKTSL
ncbi:hypothetical protein PABG_04505 [Paracoccidioides brasiliensis Pb03]|nr:hypothetical protein PABG_04505 [Paracoccidioides brasiliensis Pb03]